MAESAPRNPRSIALEKNQDKPAGEPRNFCGACGLPSDMCQCSQQKAWGEGTMQPGTPVVEQNPFK